MKRQAVKFLFSFLLLTQTTFCFSQNSSFKKYYQKMLSDQTLDLFYVFGNQEGKKSTNDAIEFENELFETAKDIELIEMRAGFRKYFFEKDFFGMPVKVFVSILWAYDQAPLFELKSEFVKALGSADIVFYSGHSRAGDGFPDFGSQTGNFGKIFYKDLDKGWQGFQNGFFNPTKYQILVINSCRSGEYYLSVLRNLVWEKKPGLLGLVLTTENNFLDDNVSVAKAFLKEILMVSSREQILKSMNDAADFYKRSKKLKEVKKGDLFFSNGLFNSLYENRPKPRRKFTVNPFMQSPF